MKNLRQSPMLALIGISVMIAVLFTACGSKSEEDILVGVGNVLLINNSANSSIDIPDTSSALISDSFSGSDGQPLLGRRPESGSSSESIWFSPDSAWWQTDDDSLVLTLSDDRDFRAVIDTGHSLNWVRSLIVYRGGLLGLVIRYEDELNWTMVWVDGSSLVAAGMNAGVFAELGRESFEWSTGGRARYFDLVDIENEILAFVDNQLVFRFPTLAASEGNRVGFFVRGSDKNEFEEITVWETPSHVSFKPGRSTPNAQSNVELPKIPTLTPPNMGNPLISEGEIIFGEQGCGACHAVTNRDDSPGGVAPNLDDVGNRAFERVAGLPGSEYVKQSILRPSQFVVDGYLEVMPSFDGVLSSADLNSLTVYLLSLTTGESIGSVGIYDSLVGGVPIHSARSPEWGETSATWIAENGRWKQTFTGLAETTGYDADTRLVIESSVARVSVSVDVLWRGGSAGLVIRYSDPSNWVTVFYNADGFISVVMATDQTISEIGRTQFDWGDPGKVRRLKIIDHGDDIDVWVDDSFVLTSNPKMLPETGSAGIYTRGFVGNEFSNFAIVESGE